VEARFEARLREAHRIGRRLVDAVNSKGSRARAGCIRREPHQLTHAQLTTLEQLPRDQDSGTLVSSPTGD
jgi:hypothetical protein